MPRVSHGSGDGDVVQLRGCGRRVEPAVVGGFSWALQPGPGGQLQTRGSPGEHEHRRGSRDGEHQWQCRGKDLVSVALAGEHAGEVENLASLGRGIHGRLLTSPGHPG